MHPLPVLLCSCVYRLAEGTSQVCELLYALFVASTYGLYAICYNTCAVPRFAQWSSQPATVSYAHSNSTQPAHSADALALWHNIYGTTFMAQHQATTVVC